MSTVKRGPRVRRAQPARPDRRARITHVPEGEVDCYTVRLTVNGEAKDYDLVAADAQAGPLWLMRQVRPTVAESVAAAPYEVVIDSDFGNSCTCAGGRRWGHCKHVDALRALTEAGRLPDLCRRAAAERPLPVCPVCYGRGGSLCGDADGEGLCRECGE